MAKLMAFRWLGRLKVTVATGVLESISMWSFKVSISRSNSDLHAHLAGKASIARSPWGVITGLAGAKNNGGQYARRWI
jgi:hypothetical protein